MIITQIRNSFIGKIEFKYSILTNDGTFLSSDPQKKGGVLVPFSSHPSNTSTTVFVNSQRTTITNGIAFHSFNKNQCAANYWFTAFGLACFWES